MQDTGGSSGHQHHVWDTAADQLLPSGQALTMDGLNSGPWQQASHTPWNPLGPPSGVPTLRSIMHEEQQAAAQAHAPSYPPGLNPAVFGRQANLVPSVPPSGMTMPPAMQQSQPQIRQKSAGFYMNSENRDEEQGSANAMPSNSTWAQMLRSGTGDASGGGGMQQNGHVDLRMATEAFRDAFSAAAPPMHGPADVAQDPLMLEALKSPVNPISGNVHCLACGKGLRDHTTLAQHLKDKHHGCNDADAGGARGNFTLGDLMAQAQAKRAAAAAQPAPEKHQKQYSAFTPGDVRGMREYLKSFPNKASLAMAVHKELGNSGGKKKMSRLKRIILRERADKAAVQAGTAAEQAAGNLVKSKHALECLQKQLKEAEQQLSEGKIGNIPEASALTHKQVLEMAVAEASRRVQEASKKVTDAEAEAVKKTEERAKVWKSNAPSSSSKETTPNSSIEILPKAAPAGVTTSEGRSHSSPVETKAQAAQEPKAEAVAAKLQEQTSADDEYVAEQLQLLGIDPQDGYSADGDAAAESDSDSSQGDIEGRGLEAFEDVLSSWLTAAHTKTSHAMVKAQASLPLRPRGVGVGQSGGPSTLQRIQEQQQQLQQEEEAEEEQSSSADGEAGKQLPGGITSAGQLDSEQVLAHARGKQAAVLDQAAAAKGPAPAKGAVPSWLADVSSDEDDEDAGFNAEQNSSDVQAPGTASVADVKPEISGDSLREAAASDSPAQHAKSPSGSSLPPPGPRPPTPALADSPSPTPKPPQSSTADHASLHDRSSSMSSQGVSSQDRKVDPDFPNRPRFDPSASWPSPTKGGYPAQGSPGQERGPTPLPSQVPASSLPPPMMYSADQGLAPQALQHWKEQFRGLYNSFQAERPVPGQFLGPAPRSTFTAQPFESPNTAANAHEFECAVCGVTCCGIINFEQHCTSKKHLRKAAGVAHATVTSDSLLALPQEAQSVTAPSSDTANGTTYVGYQAQCRTYCKQVISAELNRVVVELLQQLLFWQERQKAQDPLKAAKKKRLVSGLREVAKAVKLRRAKTIVVAPNIEQIESEGGLDDLLGNILSQAEAASLPVVFALSRKKMGQVFGCRKKMSAIAILDFSGANELFHQMSLLAQQGRLDFRAHATQEDSPGSDQLPPPDMDPMALNASDSDSDGAHQPGSGPVLYRLRADGRRVPLTEGHGVNLAQRKGLMQEVLVSPRKASHSLTGTTPAFAASTSSQPESVVLHSVELPQVQLGEPEVADSSPEGETAPGGVSKGAQMGLPYSLQNLQAHPSLLQLQQRQQSQQSLHDLQSHLNTSSGTHSAPLSGLPPHQGSSSVARISSLSSLSSEYAKASERERSSQAAAALAAQQASSMPQWGGLNASHVSSATSGAAAAAAATNAQHAAHMAQLRQVHGRPGSALPRAPFGVTPPGMHKSAPLETAGSDYARSAPLSGQPGAPHAMHGSADSTRLGSVPPFRGSQTVGPQLQTAPPPLGIGYGVPGGVASPHALQTPTPRGFAGPDTFNTLVDSWQGQPRPALQAPGQFGMAPPRLPPGTGYGAAYAPSLGYQGPLPAYGGHYLTQSAPPQSPRPLLMPWQQPQQQGWQKPQHMNPYPRPAQPRGMQPPLNQYQQQHMMQRLNQQLNADAQEWKPTWA